MHVSRVPAKKPGGNDLGRQRRKLHYAGFGPVEDMQVNRFSSSRASAILGGLVWPAARTVDALAAFCQPCADLLQHLDLSWLDAAIGHRADVEQEVPVSAGTASQD